MTIKEKYSKSPSPSRSFSRTLSLTNLAGKNGDVVLVQTDRALARFSGHVERQAMLAQYPTGPVFEPIVTQDKEIVNDLKQF